MVGGGGGQLHCKRILCCSSARWLHGEMSHFHSRGATTDVLRHVSSTMDRHQFTVASFWKKETRVCLKRSPVLAGTTKVHSNMPFWYTLWLVLGREQGSNSNTERNSTGGESKAFCTAWSPNSVPAGRQKFQTLPRPHCAQHATSLCLGQNRVKPPAGGLAYLLRIHDVRPALHCDALKYCQYRQSNVIKTNVPKPRIAKVLQLREGQRKIEFSHANKREGRWKSKASPCPPAMPRLQR